MPAWIPPRPLQIGRHLIQTRAFVAPMAGVTDRPFRQLCRRLGAGYAVGEMAASNALLWATEKTSRRINHDGEPSPKVVQIAGGDPAMMAEATAFNIDKGADIIDLNMGCPAKKVCNKAAGSALLRHEDLVREILERVCAVGRAHNIPITLKTRTGWSPDQKTLPQIARMAEDIGIALLTVHGRTREDQYRGAAEHDTLASIRESVSIPLVANGDIRSPQEALAVLRHTGADAVMIGRAGQGRPWLYHQTDHFLQTGELLPDPDLLSLRDLLLTHLQDHYAFHGEERGVRSARKHIGWTLQGIPGVRHFRELILSAETVEAQVQAVTKFFDEQPSRHAA